MTIELLFNMLDVAINYFAQRRPSELGRFVWTIDRKDRTLTQMEHLWTTLILPIAETRSALEPFARVEGFNYSHFVKYELHEETADAKVKKHMQWMRESLPLLRNDSANALNGIDINVFGRKSAGLKILKIVLDCSLRT